MNGSHALLAIVAAVVVTAAAGQHASMPPGVSHEEHARQMKQRGNLAMGFDQDKASHHFRLTPGGGIIEVTAKDSGDDTTRKQIRNHLRAIAREFSDGVFTSPTATHAEVPPGVLVLQARKAAVHYSYRELPNGGRIVIDSTDDTARKAVHDFLRYQIREHATGDPTADPA